MGDHERGKLDDSGFHYDGCAGGPCGCDGGSGGSPRRGGGGDGLWIIVGLIVVFGGVIGLAELTRMCHIIFISSKMEKPEKDINIV